MEIQARMTELASLGASWVMWVLIGLSIVGAAIALERAWVLARSTGNTDRLREDLRESIARGDLAGIQARLATSRAFEHQIVAAAIEGAPAGAAASEEKMQGAAQLAKLRMERRLAFLGTIGSNAPFVGLLGTVIGIINAFQELDASGGKVSAGLMSEIGEALVATAIGILVALPAIAAFNYFQRVIKARLASADAIGRDVLAHLKAA